METEILNVIERIYAAGAAREGWNDLLEEIPDLAGGEAANLLVARPKTGTMTVLSPRTDRDVVQAFLPIGGRTTRPMPTPSPPRSGRS